MPQLGACVINLGCKVNRIESDWFETSLTDEGCVLVAEDEADVIVVNTCAVTGEAQAKARKAVRRAAAANGKPFVAVTGCVANLFPDELEALGPNVRVFASKDDLVKKALEACSSRVGTHALDDEGGTPRPHSVFRARRGVKVQDGCDNQCTYCIVWRARGNVRSTDLSIIESQVRQVIAEGAGEIVLSGINLGRFECIDTSTGQRIGLDGLIDLVCSWGAPLVRISSIEPQDLTPEIVQAMARHTDQVAAHLHLPLQAGCDATLERMGRRYNTAQFAQTVDMVRASLPDVSLSTDVIVGFPQETDEEFEQTLAFCREVGFSKIHVFRYSARPDTPAATMVGQVAPHVMRCRSEALRKVADEMRRLNACRRIGDVEQMLVEYCDNDGWATGTTASYHDARLQNQGKIVEPGVITVRHVSYDEAEGSFVSELL